MKKEYKEFRINGSPKNFTTDKKKGSKLTYIKTTLDKRLPLLPTSVFGLQAPVSIQSFTTHKSHSFTVFCASFSH
jgi:hypothetical protein